MSAGSSFRMRLKQALGLAERAAADLLAVDAKSGALDLALLASDALNDYTDTGGIADLQRAAGLAIASLVRALSREHGVRPADLAAVGKVIGDEAIEIIDREIEQVDAAIAGSPRAAKQPLYQRRCELRREKQRIRAALRGKSESIEEVKL